MLDLSAILVQVLALAVDVYLRHHIHGTCLLLVSSSIQGLPDFRKQCKCVYILRQDASGIRNYTDI